MKITRRHVLGVAAGLSVGAVLTEILAGCSLSTQRIELSGRVVDPAARPVRGALVFLRFQGNDAEGAGDQEFLDLARSVEAKWASAPAAERPTPMTRTDSAGVIGSRCACSGDAAPG